MKKGNLFGMAVLAGLMLLVPRLADSHSGSGSCADCHTMHNSQNGAPIVPGGPQPRLLKYDCKGCHARTFNDANGRAATVGPYAPQVGPQVAGGGPQNSGGYFSVSGGATDATTHNVLDLVDLGARADSLIWGTTSPGGTFALKSGTFPVLTCEDCHDLAIGHAPANSARAGDATSSYRMLHRGAQYVKGTGDLYFESGAGQNVYDATYATSMDLFCATCHGLFHGMTNTDSIGDGSGAWIRHPTNVTTNGYGAGYIGNNKIVPVGDAGATGTNKVMCLSCHRPHGSSRPDMLRFNYNGIDNQAGDATVSLGCETCHGVK